MEESAAATNLGSKSVQSARPSGEIEQWEDSVSQYDDANRAERRQQLDEDIKTTALKALVPSESEQLQAMTGTTHV